MVTKDVPTSRRVLIVEDETLLAMNLEDMLTQLGHLVIGTATRIDKALSLAEGGEFDLAVLDINLAGSNTFEVAARRCTTKGDWLMDETLEGSTSLEAAPLAEKEVERRVMGLVTYLEELQTNR